MQIMTEYASQSIRNLCQYLLHGVQYCVCLFYFKKVMNVVFLVAKENMFYYYNLKTSKCRYLMQNNYILNSFFFTKQS